MTITTKPIARTQLRHNEYYNLQGTFDNLYTKSKNQENFYKLYEIIRSKENILLAYRNIKANTGSKTAGVNGHTIDYWKKKTADEYVEYIQKRLENYQPMKVKRVFIPKKNGKMRPLGIPTMEDRLIQQCIKQVLEPICEAKFHNSSYGFRPNRRAEHAIANFNHKINLGNNYYVIDIDIEGFFDNVDHNKLIRQIWAMGIRDKRLICIIKKMLKAEIVGEGIPTKGTPQGGILSPLLSNIVLNELDWWLSDQWETFKTIREYKANASKHVSLRKSTNLKEFYFIRYADDFKIVCKNRKDIDKVYYAVRLWLKERLKLSVSPEKTRLIDIRMKESEFLGFTFKATLKSKKWVMQSDMCPKAQENAFATLKEEVVSLQHNPTWKQAIKYNSVVRGLHNYYSMATNANINFNAIGYKLSFSLNNRIKPIAKVVKQQRKRKKWKNGKKYQVNGVELIRVQEVKYEIAYYFKKEICNYTAKGRELIHKKLNIENVSILEHIRNQPAQSIELYDNRISRFTMQCGKCAVSNEHLPIDLEIHHVKPRSKGGSDKFNNIILVTPEIHKLIHATKHDTITKYLEALKLNKDQMEKLNRYREKVDNAKIVV